ncbi:WD40-repeat-containing domain protein [Suillus spraguei]|nr:WD40-repeat-containing domain protein [Suillus spraguei]
MVGSYDKTTKSWCVADARRTNRVTTPIRTFEDHKDFVNAVVVFPDKRRMITGSWDKTLWDMEAGDVLKKIEGHSSRVSALAVSRDGQIIASGDENGEIIAWHGETGETLIQPIKVDPLWIRSLDFSPNGSVLATSGTWDSMTKFWSTKTWQMQGEPIDCGTCHSSELQTVTFSVDGKHVLSGGNDKKISEWAALKNTNLKASFHPRLL